MPALPYHAPASTPQPWFARPAGRSLLASEREAVVAALRAAPTPLPWLWIAPLPPVPPERDALLASGLCLASDGEAWAGSIRCRLPLPFASESLGTVILQHVAHLHEGGIAARPLALCVDQAGRPGDGAPGVMVAVEVADCDDPLRRRLGGGSEGSHGQNDGD